MTDKSRISVAMVGLVAVAKADVPTPPPGYINIFLDILDGRMKFKKSDGIFVVPELLPVPLSKTLTFFSVGNPNSIKPAASMTLNNWGTSLMQLGESHMMAMDGFSSMDLFVRAANSVGSFGMVTVEIYDVTTATTIISLTFSDSVMQIREAPTSISLVGIHQLICQVASTVATDNIIFVAVSVQLA